MYVESFDGMYYDAAPPLIGLELYDLVNDPNEMTSLLHFPEDVPDPTLDPWLDLLKRCSGETCRQYEDTLIQ